MNRHDFQVHRPWSLTEPRDCQPHADRVHPISAMTFTCPHLRPDDDWCLMLKTDCVCGRPGCVMRGKSVFLVPVEERIRLAAEARAAREAAALLPTPRTGRSQVG